MTPESDLRHGLILFAPGGKPILDAAGITLSPFVSVRY